MRAQNSLATFVRFGMHQLAVVVIAALCLNASGFAQVNQYDPLVIDLDGTRSFLAPTTNDNDDVVFQALDINGVQSILTRNARTRGPVLTVHGANLGYQPVGPASVSNDGTCVVEGGDAAGKGIYSRSVGGGNIITIRGNDFGFADIRKPAVGNGGEFAFHGVSDIGETGVYARSSGGVLITITGSNFSSASAPKVGGQGLVFVSAQESGTPNTGIYARSSSGGVLITIQGSNFGSSIRTFDVNDNNDVVFVGSDSLGVEGVFRSAPGGPIGSIPLMWPTGSRTTNVVATNDQGILVCGTTTHLRGADLIEEIVVSDLDGSFLNSVIAVGDPLMDSTVTELLMAEGSLSNSNRLAFYARLADGSSGIFSVRVPSPGASAALLTAAGFGLLRRRRISPNG